MHTHLATFAGGCFWCMVEPFESLPGVEKVISGYTGGHVPNPTYEAVSSGKTGHYEAVQITYDPKHLDYTLLLERFFRNIDPTDPDGQFVDRGPQYRTAIFYHDLEQKKAAEAYMAQLKASGRYSRPIVTPLLPATTFYPAEEEHQFYYKKQPFHYTLYRQGSGRDRYLESIWKKEIDREKLKETLSPLSYAVTMQKATEPPFQNAYWNNKRHGIYVDIISGTPLFSTLDQYDAGCGWPSFTKPLHADELREELDLSHGMIRTEVKSISSDAHLGHVFEDGPKEKGGLRYCINSAALRFIPLEDLEKEGYGAYLKLFKKDHSNT